MAFRYHPDHGGNHRAMVLINEAWEILSDAKLRRNYDYARNHQDNIESQQRASRDAEYARTRAETYPQSWKEFRRWIDSVLAVYGKEGFTIPILGMKTPSGGRSITAWIFIVCGGALGLYVALLMFSTKEILFWPRLYFSVAAIVGFAWLGAFIHHFIIDLIAEARGNKNQDRASPFKTDENNLGIVCPKCHYRFLISIVDPKSFLTCPRCMLAFHVGRAN